MNYSKLRFAFAGFALAMAICVPHPAAAPAHAEETEVAAEDVGAPDKFVSDLLDELRQINASDEDGQDGKVREALVRNMAVPQLQRYLIAGDIKRSATDEQVIEYNQLFSEYISAAIGDSIDRLVDRRIDIVTTTERRPGDYVVRSKVFSDAGEERAVLDWRIRDRRGKLFLTDFFVDGQSFIVERKAQFTVMVRNGGFEALLAHMNDVIADGA